MNTEGPGRESDASMGWIGKEVRLKLGGCMGQRGMSYEAELHLLGWGLFSLAVHLCSLTHRLVLSKCILNELIDECMGHNSDIRTRD